MNNPAPGVLPVPSGVPRRDFSTTKDGREHDAAGTHDDASVRTIDHANTTIETGTPD